MFFCFRPAAFALLLAILCAPAFAVEACTLFSNQPTTASWVNFAAPGYTAPVTGVIYSKTTPLTCGMPLGGVATGCLDLEHNGLLGYSTIFQDLAPRGGPIGTPLLGLHVADKSYVLAWGTPKDYEPNPLKSISRAQPLVFDGQHLLAANDIAYWPHYPIVDQQYQTSAPVGVEMRAWSPFVPGDPDLSNIPGAVFEVHLSNPTSQPQAGSLAFNLPSFDLHRSRLLHQNTQYVEMLWQPDAQPITANSSVLGSNLPPGLDASHDLTPAGRMVIADPSGDHRNELLIPLKDETTSRGLLISFQRTAATHGAAMDGSGKYQTELIDAVDHEGFTTVRTADLDGDGRLEIIASTDGGHVYSYKRKAATYGGTDSAALYEKRQLNANQTHPTAINDLCVGDLDHDGQAEVVFAAAQQPHAAPQPGVYLISKGRQTPLVTDAQTRFTGCAMGDFNGDGNREIAVSTQGSTTVSQNRITVYFLNPDLSIKGSEIACEAPRPDTGPLWLEGGAYVDGKTDSIIAGAPEVGCFWLNRAAGTLGAPKLWSAPEVLCNKLAPGLAPSCARSEPYPVSADNPACALAIGNVDLAWSWHGMRYWRQSASAAAGARDNLVDPNAMAGLVAGGSSGTWVGEAWELAGAPSIQSCAMGDLSGDGRVDLLYWERVQGTQRYQLVGRSEVLQASTPQFERQPLPSGSGVVVTQAGQGRSYALAVDGAPARFGSGLEFESSNWTLFNQALPAPQANSGTSAAIDFNLAPGERKVVRFIFGWYTPQWCGGGALEAVGNRFRPMYAASFGGAADVVQYLIAHHEPLLAKIIAWQQVVYADRDTPPWLRDSLINVLHLITECGVWATAEPPVGKWANPELGLFGLNECPRGCPQIECIPCSFFGNIPLVYFFPRLAKSTLAAYRAYQWPDGRAPWVFGGCTGGTPSFDVAMPVRGYQTVLNGACYIVMADRLWRTTADDQLLADYWDSLKRCTDFSFNLRMAYGDSQVIAMPTGNIDAEWFEAPEPGWKGYVTHAGGVRLAQAALMRRMAVAMHDQPYVEKCDRWLKAGSEAMEKHLWNGKYYSNYNEPETNQKSDYIFANQLDGEWIGAWHGLPGIFPRDRVETALAAIRNNNVRLSSTGAVNYANPDGSLTQVGGYGPYSYLPPELLMLSMTYLYAGQRDFGLWLAERFWQSITCKWGYAFDQPNIMQGKQNEGRRDWGWDYYQNLMLWGMPAALLGGDLTGPLQDGKLAAGMLAAASRIKVPLPAGKASPAGATSPPAPQP